MQKKVPFALYAAFANPDKGFRGNVAAIVLLEEEIEASRMQQIAADFNQPATTFLVPDSEANTYSTRWFAPDAEIGLCGHGTFAATAFLSSLENTKGRFVFSSPGGTLYGETFNGEISIQLDSIPVLEQLEAPPELAQALGIPVGAYFSTGNKYIVVTDDEEQVRTMQPDFEKLRQLPVFGYAVTAPGNEADFVSRTLVPHVQQLEDPATGSSHAALFPFWSERLGKTHLHARQLSRRGGWFNASFDGNKVQISGHATFIASGSVEI